MMGDVDVPHSWTYVNDAATTLVRCASDESTWGRVWHVPSNEPRSMRELFDDLADAAGLPRVRVTAVSGLVLRALGVVNPTIREALTTRYQFEMPFIIDDSESRERLYQWPTPWPLVLNSTLSPYLELSATT
jgi:nucleoside-diphosphate-sugar epimerase